MIGLVGLMNVVNFSDGVDGLAAGVCAISAVAFAIIAFDLGRDEAGVLAAIVAGAALGFLIHNFHPASVFMGDCGALLLGYLLGCAAVQGTLKTNALIALVGPLAILAVPFLDTELRDRPAAEVQTRAVVGRRPPLPPPHGADRLQPAAHGPLPLRMDVHARRASPSRCASSRTPTTTATTTSAGRS